MPTDLKILLDQENLIDMIEEEEIMPSSSVFLEKLEEEFSGFENLEFLI